MKPTETLDRTTTLDGAEMVLYHRDGVYTIRLDGVEVMASRAWDSEAELARQALAGIDTATPRVLIGGLGLGYTLRAALDVLPPRARVTVAELFPAVVAWNRGPLAALAERPLDDPRARVEVRDVVDVIGDAARGAAAAFDAILLDVDNGPGSPLLPANLRLYTAEGLGRLRQALAPGGVLAIWAAGREPTFLPRLKRAGFAARCLRVSARTGGRGPFHALFLAHHRPAAGHAGRRRGSGAKPRRTGRRG